MEQYLSQFLDNLTTTHNASQNTTSAYRNDLGQFQAFMRAYPTGPVECAGLTAPVVEAYVVDLQQGATAYASSSVARKVAAVKSFCRFLVEINVLTMDPAEKIGSPKVKKHIPHILTQSEMTQLLEAPARLNGPKASRDTALLAMLYATGMRVTEIVTLRLEDVNWEEGAVICRGKSGQHRHIPLGAAHGVVAEYLKIARPSLARESSPPMLFLNHRGQKLTRQGVWLILKEAAHIAGLGELVTPHTLRHSFAKHMLGAGENLRRVQALLGHANVATTQAYRHLSAGSSVTGAPAPETGDPL